MSFNFTQAEFDLWAQTYDADAGAQNCWVAHERVAEAVKTHLPCKTISNIVDLGTGTGLLLPHLKDAFSDACLVGVDLSQNMLEECRKKNLADELIAYDLTEDNWPIQANQAQLATASGVLEFVQDSDKFIHNTASIVQEGGLAVITYQPPHLGKKLPMGASRTYSHLPRDISASFEKASMEILEHTEFAAYRHYGMAVRYGLVAARKLG